jgi:uncharacterized membrane protein YhaH (DUF805 family)
MKPETIEQIIATVYILSMVIPIAKILQRTGFSTWWMLLMFVPLINIVGLWLFAFGKWTGARRRAHQEAQNQLKT